MCCSKYLQIAETVTLMKHLRNFLWVNSRWSMNSGLFCNVTCMPVDRIQVVLNLQSGRLVLSVFLNCLTYFINKGTGIWPQCCLWQTQARPSGKGGRELCNLCYASVSDRPAAASKGNQSHLIKLLVLIVHAGACSWACSAGQKQTVAGHNSITPSQLCL